MLKIRSKGKGYFLKWLSFALAMFITGEIALRGYKTFNRGDLSNLIIPSSDKKFVYELNPGYPGVNSFGMRQGEFGPEDTKGKYVIAVIGDSHTYSNKVKDPDKAYPQRIEHYLKKINNNKEVKVLNFGVPGYNTAQELESLKQKALRFRPNLVILQYCINDTHICNFIQPENRFLNHIIHKSEFLVFLWRVFLYLPPLQKYTYENIGKKFPDALLYKDGLVGTLTDDIRGELPERRMHPARTKERVPPRYHHMIGFDNWLMHLHEFAGICRDAKIELLATGFIEGRDRGAFLKEGFTVYSFYDIFNGLEMGRYGYDRRNTKDHFDEKGCDFIGNALARFINERYLKES